MCLLLCFYRVSLLHAAELPQRFVIINWWVIMIAHIFVGNYLLNMPGMTALPSYLFVNSNLAAN